MGDETIAALPQTLQAVDARPLFVMRLVVPTVHNPGGPAGGEARLGVIASGTIAGERIKGTVLEGGNDWQTIRSDGVTLLDAALMFRTDDGATVGMRYQGMRHGPAEVMQRLARGEAVDPSEYYFRTTASFVTSAPRYVWLSGLVAVGIGHRYTTGPLYHLFEIA